MESQLEEVLSLFNYREMKLSVLQDYETLNRGITALLDVQDTQEIISRLINLETAGPDAEKLSLRPEGTINVLNHVATRLQDDKIHRIFYQGPMFRRTEQNQPLEFNQLGVELLGSDSILSENEVIGLGMRICHHLGLKDAWLDISSFGCNTCRPVYFQALRVWLDEHKEGFCRDCYDSLYHNPLQSTQCSDEKCLLLIGQSPAIQDHLCPKCQANFTRVRKIQANLGNSYKVNPHLVKNFSYYNETVFNFMLQTNGKAEIIGGGGRYDYLSNRVTGRQIPAVGFYFDLDLIHHILTARGLFHAAPKAFRVYVCSQSAELEIMTLQVVQELHQQNISTLISSDLAGTDQDTDNAVRNECQAMIILRSDNIREGRVLLKNLVKENQVYVSLSELVPEIELIRKTVQ
jgi:histidyl-tRNA synthetase